MGDSRGFSLIEMVIVIIVLGIMAAVAAPIALTGLNAYNAMHDSVATNDKLRYATERLARELREVKFEEPIYSFSSMSTTAPVFTKADDVTVTIGNSPPNVTLAYSTPTVSPAPVLTDQVSSLAFAYFDESGNSTTSTTAVRFVEVSLTLTQGAQSYSERTRVQLRNR